MNSLARFDNEQTETIRLLLAEQHDRIGQLSKPVNERKTTAKNYDTAIRQLGDFMNQRNSALPTKAVLESWRDDMCEQYAVGSVNAKLSAARKLLRAVADETTDITVKFILRDWADISDAKETVIQDKVETDYGKRLTLESAQRLIQSIPTNNLKGLRDRAIVCLGIGAGLRVSEISRLTMQDTFGTTIGGEPGIHIRKSKGDKTRVVVMGKWNQWVFDAVRVYTDAIGITLDSHADERVFRGVKPLKTGYRSQGKSLTTRSMEAIFEPPNPYLAWYNGEFVRMTMHDLRRTFAYLCIRVGGMSWEALRKQLGHSSILITQRYVGLDVPVEDRIAKWTIEL